MDTTATLRVARAGALAGTIFLATLTAQAQQAESPVSCNEGSEPTALAYGDHTTGCEISPATDVDTFEFCGQAGDQVRINVLAAANLMDPELEVRDPSATVVASGSCIDSCAFALDFELAVDGCHSLQVVDIGGNDTGAYMLQVERLVPAPAAAPLAYDEALGDSIDPATDIDFFAFDAAAGTDVRLVVSAVGNLLDPTVEIRAADGSVLVDGIADAATCIDSCTFAVDFTPVLSGAHALAIYDRTSNDTGAYTLSLLCLAGACPGIPDPSGPAIAFDEPVGGTIEPPVDADFYRFEAAAGMQLRLNALAAGNLMDPTVEIRDSAGSVVVDGVADGASCIDSCSFSVDFTAPSDGQYSLLVYDRAHNDAGDYALSLWCLSGACPPASGAGATLVSYHTAIADTVETALDADFYRFHATAGTQLRLVGAATGNFMDPTVEIRDPGGSLVINGVADGASCVDSCTFAVDLVPAASGFYSLLIYDRTTNESGDYALGLWCLHGPCDGDGDGIPDGNVRVSFDTPVVLGYGAPALDDISPAIDSDIFVFGGTAGDMIRVTVSAVANFMDPTIEIRDPTGGLIVDGVADGASCIDSCVFSLDLTLAATGTYELAIYDRTINDSGDYEIGLQCLAGVCSDASAMCGDNCTDFANSVSMPDDGGNSQLDTNGDGYGNACDPDLNDDGMINFIDLDMIKDVFFGVDADADFNGDGMVNFVDLNRMKRFFFGQPGPSCTVP